MELDLAWAAGVLDGEGCVRVYQASQRPGKVPWIVIDMCDEPTISRLADILGAKVYGPYKPKNPKHSVHWRISWSYRQALRVAKLLLSFAFTKRSELLAILEHYGEASNGVV